MCLLKNETPTKKNFIQIKQKTTKNINERRTFLD